MLADQLDYIVGVDPHRDSHALAIVHVVSGAVVFESTVDSEQRRLRGSIGARRAACARSTSVRGRRHRLIRCRPHSLPDRPRERVLEVGRLRRERRSGGKTDALDAVRAARSVLGQQRPATPRAGGERQALQALVAAREGAVNAKRAGLCQLRDLLITTPEPLRSELRPLTRARLLQRLAATRPHGRTDAELRGSLLALRSIARRVLQLTAEERELARQIETLTRKLAPQLLDQPGVGPHAAAQLVLSWSHQGRISSRSRLRPARRRSTDPRLLRPDDPLPARPIRRPQTQPRPAHDPRHTQTHTPRHDRLHRTPPPRRQNPTRSKPLPQALPRPQPLPAPRARTTNDHLTDIEASLAQASVGLFRLRAPGPTKSEAVPLSRRAGSPCRVRSCDAPSA